MGVVGDADAVGLAVVNDGVDAWNLAATETVDGQLVVGCLLAGYD